MKMSACKENADRTIAARAAWFAAVADAEERLGKDYSEFTDEERAMLPEDPGMYNVADARRTLELVSIAEHMPEDEKSALLAIPAYSGNLSSAKCIKDKYSLSWNELRRIRSFLW